MKNFNRNLWAIFIIIPVVLIATFRVNVGTDFENYLTIYTIIDNSSLISLLTGNFLYRTEPLFIILTKLSAILFDSFTGFLFLSSFFTYFMIIKGLMNFEKDFPITFGLFIFFMMHYSYSLNIIRQFMAIAVVLYGFKYIMGHSFIKYLITILIATLFHNSAIIAILFYLFANWNFTYNNKNYRNIVVITYIFLLIFSPIIIYIVLSNLDSIPILQRYSVFLSGEIEIGIGFIFQLLIFFIPIVIFVRSLKNNNFKYIPFLNILLLNFPLQFLGYYGTVASRLSLYTEIGYYLVIPALIVSINKSENKITVKFYYILVLILFYIFNFIMNGHADTYPYLF